MGQDSSEHRWDFFVSYAHADTSWAEWIAWTLEEAGYQVLLQTWDFAPGTNWLHSIQEGITRADRMLVILSSSYAASVFGQAEWMAAWSADPRGFARRVLPIRVDDSPPPDRFMPIFSLGIFGLDEVAAREKLLSGVSAVLRGGAEPPTAPQFPASISVRPVLSERAKPDVEPSFPGVDLVRDAANRLEDVFRPVGVPTVTFVAPEEYIPFRLALRQHGLCIVLEGPSGIGKTTLLKCAIDQDSQRLEKVETYSARIPGDVERIRRLPAEGHVGLLVIDDFHRLPEDLQGRIVDYLKRLADDAGSPGKLVIVGIPDTAATLVSISFDIANRIRVFRLGRAGEKQVLELVEKGEAALNISFDRRQEIVQAAAGSLITAQSLCSHLVMIAGVEESRLTPTVVQAEIPTARANVTKELRDKYGSAVNTFAAMDDLDKATCIDLLLALGQTEDGILALDDVQNRSSDLMPTIEKIFVTSSSPGLDPDGSIARHFFYDSRGRRIIADDPQLIFFLRQLRRDELLSMAGKRLPVPREHVFICYSHVDTDWHDRLLVQLTSLKRDGILDIWSDKRIEIGDDWREEINAALSRARFAVLLVSGDFIASEFIRKVELPALLAAAKSDGCRIIPILVRASTYKEMPELERFQHVNPGGKTLASLSTEEAEQVLANVARSILKFAKRRMK
ncbi:TIR domain-containing protein [Frankia sp. CiP1_Cm_nod2]|uniref:TIR domain-containing protein n=1 Tax=Frankia sp. CiP1_Cm_nod2 TaxID=2897161 RepID=UPI0020250E47